MCIYLMPAKSLGFVLKYVQKQSYYPLKSLAMALLALYLATITSFAPLRQTDSVFIFMSSSALTFPYSIS